MSQFGPTRLSQLELRLGRLPTRLAPIPAALSKAAGISEWKQGPNSLTETVTEPNPRLTGDANYFRLPAYIIHGTHYTLIHRGVGRLTKKGRREYGKMKGNKTGRGLQSMAAAAAAQRLSGGKIDGDGSSRGDNKTQGRREGRSIGGGRSTSASCLGLQPWF